MSFSIAKLTQLCILQPARFSSSFLRSAQQQQTSAFYSLHHLQLLQMNNDGTNRKLGHSSIVNGCNQQQPLYPKLLLNTPSTWSQSSFYSSNPAGNLAKKEEQVDQAQSSPPATTYKEKLKQAMAQYGSTVIVFHITISLISLGVCYTVVASGLDLSALFEKFGLSEKSINKLASSSGTFAAAYLVHKVFAPVRLSITLTCTPFIVRYLRKAGFIKKALPKEQAKKPLHNQQT